MASASGTEDPPISRTAKRPRHDTSLCFLTQRVCMILRDSCSRVIDLNALAKTLKVPKRRLYDVTNVLEGISLARKKSKNHIEWLGNKSDILSHEMNILIQTERKLDELINSCTGQLHQMSHNTYTQRFAYLTYEDVQRIPNLKEQTVIVIKAPPGTKLEVPHPVEQSAEPRDGGGFASVLKPMASASGTEDPPISRTAKRPRHDTSLCFLTQRVCMILRDSCSRVIDLNALAKTLKVPKRRLYDVTNVLEGISLARKKSKNHIEWLGNKSDILSHEMNILIQTERKLDELINSCTGQLHQMSHNTYTQRFAYLTYEDVQRIPNLKEQTVIVIKAPPGTKLEVPHPVESLQVHLASTKGPIEAFLCTDGPFPNDTTRACVLNGSSSGPFGPLQQSPSAASSTAPPVSSFHPTGDR
ncbi:transcription factor E2F3 isoform X2 [Takifugu rubripes]|nr:transcription factor E2F3-like isoform X2 [Takifugu rubripes]XP_029701449.1 transcription factor E2F3-like isoform X2 [Takifugu rubripes]